MLKNVKKIVIKLWSYETPTTPTMEKPVVGSLSL